MQIKTNFCQTLGPARPIFFLEICNSLVTETTFNLDNPATSNNQYFILLRFYYSSNEYFDMKYWSSHLFVHFVLPFLIKGLPGCLSFSCADFLAFLFSEDISIASGCFFPGLDPSVSLIGHAAITEMIKLQFTMIIDRIRNKIRYGNWFPKFSINRKE